MHLDQLLASNNFWPSLSSLPSLKITWTDFGVFFIMVTSLKSRHLNDDASMKSALVVISSLGDDVATLSLTVELSDRVFVPARARM